MAPVSPLAPHGATTRIGKSGLGHFPRQPKIPGRDQEFGDSSRRLVARQTLAASLVGARLALPDDPTCVGRTTNSPRDSARPVRSESSITVLDRKSTRLNSSHLIISYAVFCL